MWCPHLYQDLIQPGQRTVQVYLDPARCAGDVLSVIIGAPTLHETQPYRTHFRQLVHGLETVIHRLGEQTCELYVTEDSQSAAGRYLAHRRRVEAVVLVTIARLHENCRVRQALDVHFTVYVKKVHPLADVAASVLDRGVSIDVAQLTQTKSIAFVAGVRETVYDDRCGLGVKHFPDTTV